MIRIAGVTKSFNGKAALSNLSLEIGKGECFGLLGPNGAGKTTLVNLISGLWKPDSGDLEVLGRPAGLPDVRRGIGVCPQEIALYENLSILDNLRYFGELYGMRGGGLERRIEELLTWTDLLSRKRDPVRTLSGGMKRRVNLVAALLHSPILLLVDEPTVGVDPQARLFIYKLIQDLTASGTTLLYTTHAIPEAERLCRRVAILDEGRLVALGLQADLAREDGGLESAYFRLTGKELRE